MKKIYFAVTAIISCFVLCMSAFADSTYTDIETLKVESAKEILGEDEMQMPDSYSDKATLYAFFEGEGTEEEPYEIYTADDLFSFAEGINSGSETTSHYKLMDDIDLGGRVWESVGCYHQDIQIQYMACFSGVFDGNGHTVSNFVINSTNSAYVGFFGFVYNGTVKNLTLSDFSINVNAAKFSAIYAGGLVGRCIAMGDGKNILIENCKTEKSTVNVSSSGSVYAGGLAGYVMSSDSSEDSFVRNCESGVDVYALSDTTTSGVYNVYAGGLIGYTGATVDTYLAIEKCRSYGKVQAMTAYDIFCSIGAFGGGLLGFSGVSGNDSVLDINRCYSISPVYAECTSAGYSGGFTAYIAGVSGEARVTDCYSVADVSAVTHGRTGETNYMISGAFSGAAEPNAVISTCFALGEVSDLGSQDSYVGPILGYDFGATKRNCFYADSVALSGINKNLKGATAVNSENAKVPETYTGFNFSNVWMLYEEGYKYPVLRDVEPLFKVDFIARDKVFESILAKYGDALVLPAKIPDKYTEGPNEFLFKHWSFEEGGEAVPENTKVTDLYKIYAVFEGRYQSFDFVFMNGENVYERKSVIYGEKTSEPSVNPTKPSDVNFWYRFKYWSTSPAGLVNTPVSEIVADKDYIFYAIYDAFDHNTWNGKDEKKFSAGIGTKERPYEIRSGYELYYLAREVNSGNKELAGAYYELCADIDLAGSEWLPIGEKGNEFCGVFDGNGYTVKNMYISKVNNYSAGLFGYVTDADISRIVFDEAKIDIKNSLHTIYAGILTGYASNSVINQIGIINSTISVSADAGIDAGMVAGRANSIGTDRECIISECYSDAVLEISSEAEISRTYAGQIVGYASVFGDSSFTVLNCYGLGDVSSKADMAYAGGIVGSIIVTDSSEETAMSIDGCFVSGTYNKVKAEGVTRAYAGSILGFTEAEVDLNKIYSLSGFTVEAKSQTEDGVVLMQGEKAESADFRSTEFLSDNLGFDMDGVWYFADEYAYPELRMEKAPKAVFNVTNVGRFSSNITLEVNVGVIEQKPYRVTVSAYSERDRLIGIKTVVVNDSKEGSVLVLPFALENVRDASYIKITVLDEVTRTLLFPSVLKRL